MSCIGLTCKRIFGHCTKVRQIIIPQRYVYVKPSLKVFLNLGGVSIIPYVSAQSELNSDKKNVTSDNEGEKHESDRNAGWERVKTMFQKDEFGSLSKEVTAVLQSTCIACFCGMLYGGIQSSRIAFRDFMERNQATLFENHLDAKRRLQNHVTIHFGKGALHWGIKLSVFNAGFMLFLTTMLAYRGETNIVDYMISGTVVGSILKFRLGPRAVLVGGAVGCFLGAMCGVATQSMFFLTGRSLDDIIAFQYELDQSRVKLFKEYEAKEAAKLFDKETVNLLKSHDGGDKLTNME